jgi:hypothetical protein
MADDMAVYCGNCRFYNEDFSECRRLAPRPGIGGRRKLLSLALIAAGENDDDYNTARWPSVEERDWCGEWDENHGLPREKWVMENSA